MTTAIDTNIIVALWDVEPMATTSARSALESAARQGLLVVAAPVFAELLAGPRRSESFVNGFFGDTGIAIDWDLSEAIWRLAGRAFRDYAKRRRKHRAPSPRRLLADFMVGAHAAINGYRLLTLDERLYRAAFPKLVIETV
jgi:predicted nucleic acid-binding protein